MAVNYGTTARGGLEGKASIERELERIKKLLQQHLGVEQGTSDYPHPSQRVRSLVFGNGLGELTPEVLGLSFLYPIVWTNSLDDPNVPAVDYTDGNDPFAFIRGTGGDTPLLQIVSKYDTDDWIAITLTSPSIVTGSVSIALSYQGNASSVTLFPGGAAVPAIWVFANAYIQQASLTADPTSGDGQFTDGAIWYRSDLDTMRLRANGITRNLSEDGDWSELTIATGAITITTSRHKVDTQSDAGTDDLDTISGGTDGQFLILTAADSARTVVCKDGTGNLKLAGDFSLDNAEDTIMLVKQGSNWLEVSRSDNGA